MLFCHKYYVHLDVNFNKDTRVDLRMKLTQGCTKYWPEKIDWMSSSLVLPKKGQCCERRT